jgi:hypothetical protein
MLLACAGDHELQRLPGQPDGPVWHSRLSGFPVPRPFYPADSRHVCNSRLLFSSLHGQNPEYVLTILGGSASVVVSMTRTTPPKEEKVGTSSEEAPMA